MTKLELRNKIQANKLKIAEVLDAVAEGQRELKNVEKIQIENLKEEIQEFERQLTATDEQQRSIITLDSASDEKFSLVRYFRNIRDNKPQTGIEAEVAKLGQESFMHSSTNYKGTILPLSFQQRTLTAGGAGLGAETVSEVKFDLLMPLRAKSVLSQAGATFYQNMKGTVSLPSFTGTTAFWKGETETAGNGGGGFTEKEFAPKRLTVYLPVSKLLLNQNSVDVEQKLMTDLVNSINAKLESTLLGNASGNTNQPVGIFYGASYGSTTGATSTNGYSKVVNLETRVNAANADTQNMCYILHPTTLGTLKTTPKAANTAVFIAENNMINGYKYLTTTHIPAVSSGKGIAFGNWSDINVMFFNGLDIVVDNLTSAKEGIINYIVTLYVDGGLVREDSIAKGWLA